MKVEAILAENEDHVIGKGDFIPWHHSGDFKRFKKITDGNALLMGARTFLGIARNYFSKEPGMTVLPGREIFILGYPKNPLMVSESEYRSIHKRGYGNDWMQLVHEMLNECRKIGIDKSNIRLVVDDDEPQAILDRIELNYDLEGKTLFIAGGAKVYHKYLPCATTIHRTIIEKKVDEADDVVKLTPESIHLLSDPFWIKSEEETEESNGITARYVTLSLHQRK